jgi:hypothetical protein
MLIVEIFWDKDSKINTMLILREIHINQYKVVGET